MYFKIVFLVFIHCVGVGKCVHVEEVRGYAEEPLGHLTDISWKLPRDGGGKDTDCTRDIQRMYKSLENMTLWAFQMWESTASQSNGWMQGSVYQFGEFDECIAVEDPGVERQYCLASIHISLHPDHPPIHTYQKDFDPFDSVYDVIYYSGRAAYISRQHLYWGICSPASCSPDELQALFQDHLDGQLLEKAKQMNSSHTAPRFEVSFPDNVCQTRKDLETPLSTGALCFIWVVGISFLAVLVVTLYHGCILKNNTECTDAGCPKLVKVFSAIEHLDKLLKHEADDGSGELDVLWGIRFISIIFVVMGHSFGTKLASSIFNRSELETEMESVRATLVRHGDVVVDSFFVLSGVLSIIQILKVTKAKSMSLINYPNIILYRYIRIVIAYAVVIAYTAFILPLTGSGPTWPSVVGTEAESCRESWWLNLLLIQNYVGVEKMCLVQSWYIPCDFHFFLISVALCIMFKTKCRAITAVSVVCFMIFVAMLIPAVITYAAKLPATMLFDDAFLTNPRHDRFFKLMYIPSHTRAAPHLFGVLTGYLIFKYHKPDKKTFSTALSTFTAVFSTAVLLGLLVSAAIFYEPQHQYSVLEATLYAAFHRSIWGLALGTLILSCVFGNVPIVTSLLSWSAWVPLGKLVYGAYLVHLGLLIRTASLVRNPLYADDLTMAVMTLGDVVIAFIASLALYLLFEGPWRALFGIMMATKPKTQAPRSAPESYSPSGGNFNIGLELDSETVYNKKNLNSISAIEKLDNILNVCSNKL